MRNVWCVDKDPLRPAWRRSSFSMFGLSTFEAPVSPIKWRKPEPEVVTMLRDRQEYEPEVQWQLMKKSGWTDLSPTLSDKLEDFYIKGKPVAAVWTEGVFAEFDLKRMVELPGQNQLRRIKYDNPKRRSRRNSLVDLQDELSLYRCSDIMSKKTHTRADPRRVGIGPGPTHIEKSHARWKAELVRRRIAREFSSQSSPSL